MFCSQGLSCLDHPAALACQPSLPLGPGTPSWIKVPGEQQTSLDIRLSQWVELLSIVAGNVLLLSLCLSLLHYGGRFGLSRLQGFGDDQINLSLVTSDVAQAAGLLPWLLVNQTLHQCPPPAGKEPSSGGPGGLHPPAGAQSELRSLLAFPHSSKERELLFFKIQKLLSRYCCGCHNEMSGP